jgi:hypothetical protein
VTLASGGPPGRPTRNLSWSPEAHVASQRVLVANGEKLRSEAERIARSHSANVVAPAYVDLAAKTIGLSMQSRWTMDWLGLGPALSLGAGAVLLAWVYTPPVVPPPSLVWILLELVGICGVLMSGFALGQLRRSGAVP